jgi:hypothetical protein
MRFVGTNNQGREKRFGSAAKLPKRRVTQPIESGSAQAAEDCLSLILPEIDGDKDLPEMRVV